MGVVIPFRAPAAPAAGAPLLSTAPAKGQTRAGWLEERAQLMCALVMGDAAEMRHTPELQLSLGTHQRALELAYICAHHTLYSSTDARPFAAQLASLDTRTLAATRRFIFAVTRMREAELETMRAIPEAHRVLGAMVSIREQAIAEIARITGARASPRGGL